MDIKWKRIDPTAESTAMAFFTGAAMCPNTGCVTGGEAITVHASIWPPQEYGNDPTPCAADAHRFLCGNCGRDLVDVRS